MKCHSLSFLPGNECQLPALVLYSSGHTAVSVSISRTSALQCAQLEHSDSVKGFCRSCISRTSALQFAQLEHSSQSQLQLRGSAGGLF